MNMRRSTLVAGTAAGLLLSLLATPVHSNEITAERAVSLAATCAACHGTEGRLTTSVAPLAGRSSEAMQAQLLAFKADQVPGATVMNRIASGFSEAELQAIARYFAGLESEDE